MSRRLRHACSLLLLLLLAAGPARAQTATEQRIEQQLYVLTNEFRAQHGLSQLRWDSRLAASGRQHSAEMIRLHYFAHESPVAAYHTKDDRARLAGVTGLAVGENLAYMQGYAPSTIPDACMRGWINSPEHLANLMRPSYTHIGLGVVISGGTCMISQEFGEPLLAYGASGWTRPPRPYVPPSTVPARPTPYSTYESQLLGLINRARQSAGLSSLRLDDRLRQAARDHSAEMIAMNYFDRTSPNGTTLMDRVHLYGVTDLAVGEDIGQMRGYAPSTLANAALQGFMGSAADRANILRPSYTNVGIGIVASGGKAMISVVFGEPGHSARLHRHLSLWDRLWRLIFGGGLS
ncbi:MAG: CAP domain-containing protein [Candidatus Xenobia bacterium]